MLARSHSHNVSSSGLQIRSHGAQPAHCLLRPLERPSLLYIQTGETSPLNLWSIEVVVGSVSSHRTHRLATASHTLSDTTQLPLCYPPAQSTTPSCHDSRINHTLTTLSMRRCDEGNLHIVFTIPGTPSCLHKHNQTLLQPSGAIHEQAIGYRCRYAYDIDCAERALHVLMHFRSLRTMTYVRPSTRPLALPRIAPANTRLSRHLSFIMHNLIQSLASSNIGYITKWRLPMSLES